MNGSKAVVVVAGAFAALMFAVALPSLVALAESDVDRTLRDPAITESSGLVVSTLHPGVLYTHNDSIDGPRVFAVGSGGVTRAELALPGAEARDWEGMSKGPDGTLWVGDIGDNIDGWGSYPVYRFKEPKNLVDQDVEWTRYELRYADGSSRNAESLLVHPVTGRLYVVTKQITGTSIYVAPEKLSKTEPNLLRRIGKALPFATDGAFSPDGSLYVVRGYVDAEVYRTAEPGKKIATIDLPAQPQGETIAWSPDGQFLYAGSEGSGSKVYRVPLPASVKDALGVASPSASAGASGPGSSTGAESDPAVVVPPGGDPASGLGGDGLPREQVLWLGAGALVLIVLGLSMRAWAKRDSADEA